MRRCSATPASFLIIAERMDVSQAVGSPTIEEAAECWAREQHQRHRVQDLQWSQTLFVQTATSWLRFLGRLEEPKVEILPGADRLADFAAYQREERGLPPVTISGQDWHVENSWAGCANRTVAWTKFL